MITNHKLNGMHQNHDDATTKITCTLFCMAWMYALFKSYVVGDGRFLASIQEASVEVILLTPKFPIFNMSYTVFLYFSYYLTIAIFDYLNAEQWLILDLRIFVLSYLVSVVLLDNYFVQVGCSYCILFLVCLVYVVTLWQFCVKIGTSLG